MSGALESAILALEQGRVDEGLGLLAAAGLDIQSLFDLTAAGPDAIYNAGVGLYGRGRTLEAENCFARVIALAPDHLPALANRGTALVQLGRPAEALIAFEAALALAPGHPVLLNGRGDALVKLGRMAEAREAFLVLVSLTPDDADAWSKFGAAEADRGALEDALAAFDRSLALKSSSAEAAYNRGNILRDLGRFDQALAAYDRAIALGDSVDAPINKALVLMLLGDFDQGLPLYESRWRSHQAKVGQPLDPAHWNRTASLAGRRILLRAEQGHGDTIQMLRYVPVLAEAGAIVIAQVQASLVELARGAPGLDDAVSLDEPAPKADLVCPMMSLPLLLGRRPDSPGPSAYLEAPHDQWAAWEGSLGPRVRQRIGLAWSGSAAHVNDRNRSLPLAVLQPLLEVDADFVSLQADYRPGDAAWLRASGRIIELSGELDDFANTAGLIEALDLVISVDTAVAHLAGALGKPVWILLPFVPDFRWGLRGGDSPLYPSARLFRQPGPGAWEAVIAEVVQALDRL